MECEESRIYFMNQKGGTPSNRMRPMWVPPLLLGNKQLWILIEKPPFSVAKSLLDPQSRKYVHAQHRLVS